MSVNGCPSGPLHLVELHVPLLRTDNHTGANDAHVSNHLGCGELVLVNEVGWGLSATSRIEPAYLQ